MSSPPQPPGRLLTKKNSWPSRAGIGQKSLYTELIGAPALTGSPHGSSTLSRRDTQMSIRPSVPGRFDARKNTLPSRDDAGQPSRNGVLKLGCAPGVDASIRTAADHVPNGPSCALGLPSATIRGATASRASHPVAAAASAMSAAERDQPSSRPCIIISSLLVARFDVPIRGYDRRPADWLTPAPERSAMRRAQCDGILLLEVGHSAS
jgi:hypothetical protein